MDFNHTDKVLDLMDQLNAFMDKHVYPNEEAYTEHFKSTDNKWVSPPLMQELKNKAKDAGLWNLFLPESERGAGLSNLEYAPLAEIMGRVFWASEVFNCNAPDTGNMEVLDRYGSEEQKEQWLKPLLAGEIRSAFGMTEPGVASSDATNMEATAVLDGDEYVINGEKWWTSGAGDPRCKIIIFMCVTDQDPDSPRHKRHSQILVPTDSKGIETRKMMEVFGWDDAPHGHAHLKFTDVRVPKSNMILGEGRGFEIAQGRLGPGRIHHCMRWVGECERMFDMMCNRALTRELAPNKPLATKQTIQNWIAESRAEINASRLMVLDTAKKIDEYGANSAKVEISTIKFYVANVLQNVLDRVLQVHGALGMTDDTPIALLYRHERAARIYDGADEVHKVRVAREILKSYSK